MRSAGQRFAAAAVILAALSGCSDGGDGAQQAVTTKPAAAPTAGVESFCDELADIVVQDEPDFGRLDASAPEEVKPEVAEVVEEKLVRRKVSLKALDWGKIEPASGGSVRQVATLVAGINSDKARDVNKFIKGLGLKGVQTQTQGEQVRVMAKKRDQLQAVITELKGHDFGIPIDTGNFRD